ncbi:unnamed protein product [Notodromas monacha]|uniref:Uncharacterized protein n=1 Tax=Notodromas monacha TaxID=399045 RepID=A0A7R9GIL6_9CRUS|nr:unnamed protein product [Notodromas monacha]CAG0922593.1 unnamed protein product [Notodromas monacha]
MKYIRRKIGQDSTLACRTLTERDTGKGGSMKEDDIRPCASHDPVSYPDGYMGRGARRVPVAVPGHKRSGPNTHGSALALWMDLNLVVPVAEEDSGVFICTTPEGYSNSIEVNIARPAPPTIQYHIPTGTWAVGPDGSLWLYPDTNAHLDCVYHRVNGTPTWTWNNTGIARLKAVEVVKEFQLPKEYPPPNYPRGKRKVDLPVLKRIKDLLGK